MRAAQGWQSALGGTAPGRLWPRASANARLNQRLRASGGSGLARSRCTREQASELEAVLRSRWRGIQDKPTLCVSPSVSRHRCPDFRAATAAASSRE